MASDLDIYRSANALVTRYKDYAAIVAIAHAKQLAFQCNCEGAARWFRIVTAIKDIQRTERKPGENVQ